MVKIYEIKLPKDATLEEVVTVLGLLNVTVEVDTDAEVMTAEAQLVNDHPRLAKDVSVEEGILEAFHETNKENMS